MIRLRYKYWSCMYLPDQYTCRALVPGTSIQSHVRFTWTHLTCSSKEYARCVHVNLTWDWLDDFCNHRFPCDMCSSCSRRLKCVLCSITSPLTSSCDTSTTEFVCNLPDQYTCRALVPGTSIQYRVRCAWTHLTCSSKEYDVMCVHVNQTWNWLAFCTTIFHVTCAAAPGGYNVFYVASLHPWLAHLQTGPISARLSTYSSGTYDTCALLLISCVVWNWLRELTKRSTRSGSESP